LIIVRGSLAALREPGGNRKPGDVLKAMARAASKGRRARDHIVMFEKRISKKESRREV
jgi:hypothetical protein